VNVLLLLLLLLLLWGCTRRRRRHAKRVVVEHVDDGLVGGDFACRFAFERARFGVGTGA
jgi:hypothetical protein